MLAGPPSLGDSWVLLPLVWARHGMWQDIMLMEQPPRPSSSSSNEGSGDGGDVGVLFLFI